MPAPSLERHCGSWVVVKRADRKAVCEIYSKSLADQIADDMKNLEVLTAAQWLAEFNASLRGVEQ